MSATTAPAPAALGLQKAWPLEAETLDRAQALARGWNLLAGDLMLPCAVLKQSALERNAALMADFLRASGALLCPHGKTTMSPELMRRQLADGAWGITAANVQQARVMQRHGVRRVLIANQVVGRAELRAMSTMLDDDPGFELYVLVDSPASVRELGRHLQLRGGRRLAVLLEIGQAGGRTGARDLAAALGTARAVRDCALLELRGVETYEGILQGPDPAALEQRIGTLYEDTQRAAAACEEQGLFAPGPVIVSGGGSCFYDLAFRGLAPVRLRAGTLLVLRSGCYLTHDDGFIAEHHARLRARSPGLVPAQAPEPALEVWAYLQSRPESGRGYATLGKRDVSYDMALPVPTRWLRPGLHARPQPLAGHRVLGLNDQHAHLALPVDSPLEVGDMLGFGISHPCTTFDKWRSLPIVDDDYRVVDVVGTWF